MMLLDLCATLILATAPMSSVVDTLIEAAPSTAQQRALPTLEQRRRLAAYLAELVRHKTVTADQEANEKALEWVQRQLQGLPLHFSHHVWGGYHSLVATSRPTKAPAVWLAAHIDVVPAPPSLFQPRRDGAMMYGRGVYDMKMAIACYLLLMHELRDELPGLDVGIMLTSDEEVGGENGVHRLLTEAGYGGAVALLPDGGFDWHFEEAAKGAMHLKVTAQGVAAHGSRPWLGQNAINRLIEALTAINVFFEGLRDDSGYYATANVGRIEGGEAVNQVPAHAQAIVDIRFPPPLTAEALLAQLRRLVDRYAGVTLSLEAVGAPSQVDVHAAPFALFRQLARDLFDIDMGVMRAHGASDARFFGQSQIPALVVTCRGGAIHSPDEWVDLEDLGRFYVVVKEWVRQVGKAVSR